MITLTVINLPVTLSIVEGYRQVSAIHTLFLIL